METRELAALLITLLTVGGIVAAWLYVSRDHRRERRVAKEDERFRRRRNEERKLAERDA
jgi:hypothetical protein